MHVVQIIANSTSVPYFKWMAEYNNKALHKITLTFICMYSVEPKMVSEMRELGYECYWLPYDYNKRKRGWISSFFKLYRLFKKLKPDVVHTHLFDDSVPSLIAAKLCGINTRVITKQDTAFHWYYAPKAIKFDRLNNYLATHIVAVSKECEKFIIEKEEAPPAKVRLIHHGIHFENPALFSANIKKELIDKYDLSNKIIIGTVARLIDWKGHKIIINVAELIIKKHPNIVFLFVGSGPLQSEIETSIKKRGLNENIILTGYIEREKMNSLYQLMDIYIHAARFEPFGFVIAEAMFNGSPVLSTKTGASLDAIAHKENGYLVDYNDPQGFIDGINYLLMHDKKSIGEKGKKTAIDMYSFDKMWNSYLNLYKETTSLKTDINVI